MRGPPRWVSKQAVLAIHERLLAEHGGAPGLLDEGLLDAALASPRNHFAYERADIPRLAAAYAYALTQNHPFADGNKRIALTVAGVFMELNGLRLEASIHNWQTTMFSDSFSPLKELFDSIHHFTLTCRFKNRLP